MATDEGGVLILVVVLGLIAGLCSKHAVWPRDAGRQRTSHAARAPYKVAERESGVAEGYIGPPSRSLVGRFVSADDWLICKRNGR